MRSTIHENCKNVWLFLLLISHWTRIIDDNGYDYAFACIQTNNMGYAITGRSNSYDEDNNNVWLVKTDSLRKVG